MLKYSLFVMMIIGFCTVGLGQTTRDVAPRPPAPQYQAMKKEKKNFFISFKSKKKRNLVTGVEESEEFQKRMKATARKKAKESKLALQPQYSDPSYFGHKKPPKKRPNGKKKFCKECGLSH